MSTHSAAVTITQAVVDDVPALAEINRLSYMRESLSIFVFKHWPDEKNMFEFFKARVQNRFDHPDTRIFKAVDPATGEIYGFICFTLEEADVAEVPAKEPIPNPTDKAMEQMPEFLNMAFIAATSQPIENFRNLMKGAKHYYLSAFAVAPSHQGKGIGNQLLKHCLQMADEDELPTWLISFPGSHSLYLRFAFEDVEYDDLDLNEWDKDRKRGFGIYRSYCMKREPQPQ